MSKGKKLTQMKELFDTLQDGFDFCCLDRDYAQPQHDVIMKELEDIEKNIQVIIDADFGSVDIDIVRGIKSEIEQAEQNPKSDLGKMLGTLNPLMAEGRLRRIAALKTQHGTDFSPLSSGEVLAIYTYTTPDGDYRDMHAMLLGNIKEDKQIRAKIDMCKQALAKLPNYAATAWPTYRVENGAKFAWRKQYEKNKTFPIRSSGAPAAPTASLPPAWTAAGHN